MMNYDVSSSSLITRWRWTLAATYTGYSCCFICMYYTQQGRSISIHCPTKVHLEIHYHYYFFLLGTHQTMISIKFNAIRTKLITKVLVFLRSTFNWPCNHWFFFFKFLSWFHLFLWKEFESKMINWSRHWMALKKIWHLCYSFHFNLNFEL